MSIFKKIFGDPNEKVLKKLQPLVNEINKLESKFENFSNSELNKKTKIFKDALLSGKNLDEILPEAFALVRESAKRTLGQRHYDVQLLGGIVLHQGQIAEMKTGEGKTLVSTLPLYLNALQGKGAHVITVNDYLAKRDMVWMGQIYHLLGLSVSCIVHEAAYVYDPSYQVNKSEIRSPTGSGIKSQTNPKSQIPNGERDKERDIVGGFKIIESYLRPVTRREAYLADITYGTNNEFGFDYLRDNMVYTLEQKVQRELHYAVIDEVDSILIDEARTPLIISAPAEESTEKYRQFARLVTNLKENEDYNVDEKMRTATLTEEGINKIEKMLGLGNIYTEGGIDLVHHLEQALRADVLFKKDRDYVVKDGEVIIVDEFTGRLMFGRRYSEGLHQAIEAKEGVEVKRESITLATITFQNYFRMYQKLAGMTGTAATSAEEFDKVYNLESVIIPTNKPLIRKSLSDKIYKTEMGKFKAVVKEIKERYKRGQPVLLGTISIEKNELLGEMLGREGVSFQLLNAKHHEKEAEIIAQAGKLGGVTIATNMAGRGVDIVLGGNPPDLEEQRKIKQLGGLYVIGTERHEARRIDDQLRGRTGRQGDPGSSQFYVSMEDDLMRIFGSDRIKSLMNTFRIPEDMPIENKMITHSLDAAQRKVEGYNFDIRKHLLEYDDVINKHRQVIYQKRNEILKSNFKEEPVLGVKTNKQRILEMVEEEIEQVILFHTAIENEKRWDIEEIYEVVGTIFPLSQEVRINLSNIWQKAGDKSQDAQTRTAIIQYLTNLAHQSYEELERQIENPALMRRIEESILLRSIDTLWVEHLEAVDYLKTGIALRGYGQRDPLVEYKREALRMFNELMNTIRNQVVYSIYKVAIAKEIAPGVMQKAGLNFSAPQKTMEKGQSVYLHEEDSAKTEVQLKQRPKDSFGHKIGRNDPCPCGAKHSDGRPIKYKHCHGKNA